MDRERTDRILKTADRLYSENRPEEVEELLVSAIDSAAEEMDDESVLVLLNELIGHYRETSDFEKMFEAAEDILRVADAVCDRDSIPYATSLLNVATCYRTAGRLDDSLALYDRAEAVYKKALKPDSMLYAGFYNNKALLYQEKGEFENARKALLKAIEIDVENEEAYEEAVSRANLAGTYIQLGQKEEALREAQTSIRLFDSLNVSDQHYCAALSALGSYHYLTGDFEKAADTFSRAMDIMEKALGRNGYYERLRENYEASMDAVYKKDAQDNGNIKGIDLCREYYEKYGAPMIHEKFGEYEDKIAAGLAGEGSECFYLDDELSTDHDFGPSFCMWLDDATFEKIGEELKKEYEKLPDEFKGFKRDNTVSGAGRRGVMTIKSFYERLVGAASYKDIDWASVEDASLAASVNGEVWKDDRGEFSRIRNELMQGYPENVLYTKTAECCARFSQCGQYNYFRMLKRGDEVTARIMLSDAFREAMKLLYIIDGTYPLHDKWLFIGLSDLEGGKELRELLYDAYDDPENIEEVGRYLAMELYRRDITSDIDPYIGHHTEELLEKSLFSLKDNKTLSMDIAKAEFKEFDKVKNVGGRAECQNNWPTFSIMRRSQYLTWTRTMLLQYLYDFKREARLGHNLITEKYGRMMESTAPEEYDEIRDSFTELPEDKKAIIEAVVGMQVGWMEAFSERYPKLAANARSIRTSQDNLYNTSYETYLRGELSTYSDKMLELYARFIAEHAKEGKNLAFEIMENNVKLYGYRDLDTAEEEQAD
ncbi:MAG: DUF4125 family protein [Lachnospiraceae bacterium]|nr:DUF4125 family protein [Lachnospiraceae bacterium]